MKIGSLIRCSNPPKPLSNETLGVIVEFDVMTVTVKWPNDLTVVHDRKYIMWIEENIVNNSDSHVNVS